jgi:hypothetical protein
MLSRAGVARCEEVVDLWVCSPRRSDVTRVNRMLAIGSALTLQSRLVPREFGACSSTWCTLWTMPARMARIPVRVNLAAEPTWISVSFVPRQDIVLVQTPAGNRQPMRATMSAGMPGPGRTCTSAGSLTWPQLAQMVCVVIGSPQTEWT